MAVNINKPEPQTMDAITASTLLHQAASLDREFDWWKAEHPGPVDERITAAHAGLMAAVVNLSSLAGNPPTA